MRILLVHWNDDEVEDYAQPLRAAGHEVTCHCSQQDRIGWSEPLPGCVVVSLDRLPSHGKEVAESLRGAKKRSHIPLVFVGGTPAKITPIKERFHDDQFCTREQLPAVVSKAKPKTNPTPAPSRAVSPTGYSGTPLIKKLGIAPGISLLIVNEPEQYAELIGPMPKDVKRLKKPTADIDFIHLFVERRNDLHRQLPKLKPALSKAGTLWISWPKKSAKTATDLDESIVRETGLAAGLVDVKVCAIDAKWSGLKFMFRKSDR